MKKKYFKGTRPASKSNVSDPLAEKIARIANLADPGVKEFPNDLKKAAKLLHECVLHPKPDHRANNGILNAFSDEHDTVAAERVLASRGLGPTDDPFKDLSRYKQVKVYWHFVEPGRFRHRDGGWVFEVVSTFHGEDGSVVRVVRKRTRPHLRRVDAAIETIQLLDHYTQEVCIPK